MAFNDDLNKFVHNYPYTNYHEVVLDFLQNLVAELKKIVDDADLEHIQERLAAIDAALESDSVKISALESASVAASDAIQALRAITTEHTVDLEQIHGEIDGVIDQITAAVETLQGEMAEMTTDFEDYKTATDARLRNVETAAFDPSQIVMSNMPFNFVLSTLDGHKNGMRIVVDGSGAANDSIVWVDGGGYMPTNIPTKQRFTRNFKIPMIRNSGNQCHIVVPSVFPIKYSASVNWQLYFYANRWIGSTSGNVGINKQGPFNFTDLIAEGGVQITPSRDNELFIDLELFANEQTGCYDLHIYNGRNNYSTASDYKFSSIMILPIDLGTMTQPAGIQRYFNLLNTYNTQINALTDSKIDSVVNALSTTAATLENSIDALRGTLQSTTTATLLTVNAAEGVTITANRTAESTALNTDANRRARYIYVDMTVSIDNLAHNTDVTIGQLLGYLNDPLGNSHNVNVDIQAPCNGAYGSIQPNGTIAIHAYSPTAAAFGAVTARISGVVCDISTIS